DGFTDELNTRPATPSDAPDTPTLPSSPLPRTPEDGTGSDTSSLPDLYDHDYSLYDTPPATPRTAPSPLQGPL
ncbi:hypothetical protein, partial [Nocardiopsis sp. LOL_012]|uniref:hypothetical protein n=1 Tax=Nocardiopsis sp. LOL_012 TaxID=3345409 RepID=UPI003A8A9025